MSTDNKVHLPTEYEMQQAKDSSRLLSTYSAAEHVQLSLPNSHNDKKTVTLPGHTLQLFLDVLAEISKGHAVSLVTHQQELSTQEAANILNVSRPFFVKLLDSNEIPYRKIGSHRRVLLRDVITYKHDVDRKRMATLDELTQLSQNEGMGY